MRVSLLEHRRNWEILKEEHSRTEFLLWKECMNKVYYYCLYYNPPSLLLDMSVGVRKRQVPILARLSREMTQTVRIKRRSFLSRVCISLRPTNVFIAEKNTQKLDETESRVCSLEGTSDRSCLIASDLSKRSGNCVTVGRQRPVERGQPDRPATIAATD